MVLIIQTRVDTSVTFRSVLIAMIFVFIIMVGAFLMHLYVMWEYYDLLYCPFNKQKKCVDLGQNYKMYEKINSMR